MQLGVIGLSTMGANLARNAAHRGATVAVYNRTTEKMKEFIASHGGEGNFVACETLEDLKNALKPPRPILLMVKAGKPVDDVIAEVLPHLDKGDILIDGGNSLYSDTQRREKELAEKGIRFFGMGVSGGEEGALKGPSMMPGGDKEIFELLHPLLKQMAAEDGIGGTCISYIGPGGAGHFVKMVHNGIEYGIMQLIAEVYDVLRKAARCTPDQLAEIFGEWSKGEDLGSFLLEITADIFKKKDDDTGKSLIDLIVDRAGQKGTGKWTTEAAMTLGVAIPTINAAVDARIISGDKSLREVGKRYPGETLAVSADPNEVVAMCRSALELATISAYGQGFQLMSVASREYEWNLNMSEIARIWRGGCIIRSVILPKFQEATMPGGSDAWFTKRFSGKRQQNFRALIALATGGGVPVPSLSASLAYLDAMRATRLPQNLIQAQRDYFGAHTFERTDREGAFHADWKG